MKKWEGWIMGKDGQRRARIITRPLRTKEDVQKWFEMNPTLARDNHIEFEEVEDKAPVSVAVPGGGT